MQFTYLNNDVWGPLNKILMSTLNTQVYDEHLKEATVNDHTFSPEKTTFIIGQETLKAYENYLRSPSVHTMDTCFPLQESDCSRNAVVHTQ